MSTVETKEMGETSAEAERCSPTSLEEQGSEVCGATNATNSSSSPTKRKRPSKERGAAFKPNESSAEASASNQEEKERPTDGAAPAHTSCNEKKARSEGQKVGEEENEEDEGSDSSSIDAEGTLIDHWNTSFIVSTIQRHFPEKHEYEDAATPTFFPSSRHHDFFPEVAAHKLEEEEEEASALSEEDREATATEVSDDAEDGRDEVTPSHSRHARSGRTSSVASSLNSTGEFKLSGSIRIQNFIAIPPENVKTVPQPNLLFWMKPLPLYSILDVPHWQKYNPAIRGSYRAFYDTAMIFKSFLGWHNETINVWSHFLGFVIFACLTVMLLRTVLLPLSEGIPPDLGNAVVFYSVFCFGCMCCTMCSTIYHLFTGHRNCRVMTMMGRIDFVGITTLIIGSFLPPLYVLMHCFPLIRQVYLVVAITLGVMTSIACWTNTFFEHVGLRVGMFVGLAISGVGPLIHSLFLVPFTPVMISVVKGIVLMLGLYGVGVVFYVTHFPEAWFPSHFDCVFSSHQLWHYFVVLASLVHFFNCASMYQMYTMSNGNC